MLKLLFTTKDNANQLTVVTDGVDGQLNIFVTESVTGNIDYYKSIGIDIEVGKLYNLGQLKEWASNNSLRLVAFSEGFNSQAVVLVDFKVEIKYTLSTEEDTLNFPATGGQDMCVVTSYKEVDGVKVGLPVTFAVVGIGFSVDTNGQVTATVNPEEQERSGVVTVTQIESGKTIEIQLTQAASAITYQNMFTVDPQTLSFTGRGGIKDIDVISQKKKLLNGVDSGEFETIPTTIELAGVGFSYLPNEGNYEIIAEENPSEASGRTAMATISQSIEGGESATVNIEQDVAEVVYQYILTVDPEELTFVSAGETKNFSVNSSKIKVVNGQETGSAIVVPYTTVVQGEGFSKGSTDYSVTATENSQADTRTGTAVVSATEGGKTAAVALTQPGVN